MRCFHSNAAGIAETQRVTPTLRRTRQKHGTHSKELVIGTSPYTYPLSASLTMQELKEHASPSLGKANQAFHWLSSHYAVTQFFIFSPPLCNSLALGGKFFFLHGLGWGLVTVSFGPLWATCARRFGNGAFSGFSGSKKGRLEFFFGVTMLFFFALRGARGARGRRQVKRGGSHRIS